MADDVRIAISAVLGKNVANQLQKELDKIANQLKLTIKNVGVVGKQLTSTSTSTESSTKKTTQAINEHTQAIGRDMQAILSNADAYKLLRDSADNVNKIIAQTTNVVNENGNILKQQVSTIYELDTKTQTWAKSYSTVSHSMDKLHAEALKENKALEQLREKQLQYEQSIRRTIEAQKEAEKQKHIATYEKLNEQLTKLKRNATTTNTVLKNFGTVDHHKKADELTASLQRLNVSQNMTQKEMQETITQAKLLSNQLYNVSKEAKATGNNSLTMGKMISTAFEKFSIWIGVTSLFFGTVQTIRKAVAEVISLNTAVTELNKVLEVSKEELVDYTKKAYEMGEALGRTGKEVISATAEFARAGWDLSESSKLSEQALLLTNVADGLEDTAEAAGYLIAVLKGYNLTVNDTVHIVDLLNEVSNNFAVNTLKLAEGLQRTSGTLSQTGTSMEELTGILTGGYEVLRNMEKVSAGLITISTRLRGISESGEEIDGLMPKLQTAFKEFAGIDIQTVNGQMRSTFDILQDLSKVWKNLNDEQRAYIGFLTSGLRQSPVLNAIMLNWENVELAAETAMNSINSAVIENEKYLSSLQGKINLLNSALSELAYNTISSDFFGALVNFATLLVKVADAIGVFTIAFSGLWLYLSFSGKLSIAAAIGERLIPNLAALGKIIGLTTNQVRLLNIAFGSFLPMLAVGAIYLAIKAFDHFTTTLDEQKEKLQEITSEIKSLESEYAELKGLKQRTEQQEKYLQLLRQELQIKKELEARELKKTIDKEFFDIKDINIITGDVITGEKQIYDYIRLIKELREEQLKTSNAQEWNKLQEKILNIKKVLIENQKTIEGYIEKLDDVPPELQALADALENLFALEQQIETFNDAIDTTYNYTQAQKDLNNLTLELIDSLDDLASAYSQLNEGKSLTAKQILDLVSKYPELQSQLKIVEGQLYLQKDAIYTVMKAEEEKFKQELKILEQEAINHKNAVLAKIHLYHEEIKTVQDVLDARQKLIDSYKDSPEAQDFIGAGLTFYDNVAKELRTVEERIGYLQSLGTVDFISSASGIKSGAKKEIKEIAQYLSDDLAQAVDEVNLAIKESEYRMSQYDETSQEYKDEINEQIKLYGDLIKIYEKGKQKAKERNQQILDNTTYMNFLNMSTEEYNKLSEEQKERYNRLKQEYDKNVSALNQYENAILGAKSSIDGLNNSLEEQAEQMRKTALETVSNLLNIEKNLRLDALREKQEAIIKGFQDMLDPDVIFNFQDFQHAIKDIISELDLIDEKFLSGVSFVTDTSKARSDLNAYKNDIISLANQAERFADMTSTSQSGLESIIRRQINFANNLQSELQQINNIIAEKTRLYKEQEEALQQQIQSVSDEYDSQISLQEEKLKLLDEEISAEERKRRLLEINDELEKALRDKRFEYITQEGERILTYDKAKVEEIEKRQTELVEQYQREDLKKEIQDEIDLIRNAKETELKILNDKLEETKKIHATEIQALQLYKSSIEEINRAVVSDTNQKMNDLKNLQNEELDNFSKYWDNLIKAVEEGTATYDDILEVWYDESGNALKKYVDNVGSEFERLAKIWDSMQKLVSTPLPTPSKTAPSSGSFSGSKGTTSGGIDYVVGTDRSSVITPPGSNPIVTTPNGTRWSVDPKTGIPTKLHMGGIVGENIQDNKAKLINDLFQTKNNEQLITALKKEVIVNPTLGMPNFISNMRNLVSSVIPKSSAINNIKNYHFKDLTIKANNAMEFLDSIDLLVTTQG